MRKGLWLIAGGALLMCPTLALAGMIASFTAAMAPTTFSASVPFGGSTSLNKNVAVMMVGGSSPAAVTVALDFSDVMEQTDGAITAAYSGPQTHDVAPNESVTFNFDNVTFKDTADIALIYQFNVTPVVMSNNINYGSLGAFEHDIISVGAVPEPGTLMLLGTGLVGLMGYRKKFRIR